MAQHRAMNIGTVYSGEFVDWDDFPFSDGPPIWSVCSGHILVRNSEDDQRDEESDDPDYDLDDEFKVDQSNWEEKALEKWKELSRLSKHSYCLVYHGPRGEAELIRLLFVMADQPYTEHLVSDDDLYTFIRGSPYRSLPVITKGNDKWGRGDAIARTLARKFHLLGTTNQEHLVVEGTFERLCRLKRTHEKVVKTLSLEIKNKERMEFVVHQLRYIILPPVVAEWDKLILSSRGPFIVASGITLADVAIMDFLDQCTAKILLDELLAEHSALADLLMLVKQHPRIVTYMEDRPDLDWDKV